MKVVEPRKNYNFTEKGKGERYNISIIKF